MDPGKLQEAGTVVFSYHGLNIVYDKNTTSGVTTVTKHFYANGLQVAKMVGTGIYYLHQDNLGSTRLVVTSTLSVSFRSNYVPYGPSYALTGKEVYMYTGKPYDAATGLYYFVARFYDPVIGRFVTQDSYNGSKTDPLSQNRYVYARDNPMRYVDLSGHMISTGGGDAGGTLSPLQEFLLLVLSGFATITTTTTTTTTTAGTTTTIMVTATVTMPDGTTTTLSVTAQGMSSTSAPNLLLPF